GQRRRVADGEGDVEGSGQGAGEQGLAAAGGADEQDVGLVQLDGGLLLGGGEPLVVVVDGDREGALGLVLPEHVLIEELLELSRRRDRAEHRPARVDPAAFLLEDVLAELRAVRTDVDVVRPLNHRADLARALAAERAGGDPAALEAAVPTLAAAFAAPTT